MTTQTCLPSRRRICISNLLRQVVSIGKRQTNIRDKPNSTHQSHLPSQTTTPATSPPAPKPTAYAELPDSRRIILQTDSSSLGPKPHNNPKRITPDFAHPEASKEPCSSQRLNPAFINYLTRGDGKRLLRNHHKIPITKLPLQSLSYTAEVVFVGFPVTGCNRQSRVLVIYAQNAKGKPSPNKSWLRLKQGVWEALVALVKFAFYWDLLVRILGIVVFG